MAAELDKYRGLLFTRAARAHLEHRDRVWEAPQPTRVDFLAAARRDASAQLDVSRLDQLEAGDEPFLD
eukprot:scaffold99932_cov28-Tisochrysis_lutea.AAC.4